MRPFLWVAGLWVCALVFAAFAQTSPLYTEQPSLAPVAEQIAGQPLTVRCYLHDEPGDPFSEGAWAYVRPMDPVIYLSKEVCDGALALQTGAMLPLWQLGLGAVALSHEAFHLKLSLPYWRRVSEAQTECRAIRNIEHTLRALGASELLAVAILPWSLAEHYKISSLNAEYNYPSCSVPVFRDFWP